MTHSPLEDILWRLEELTGYSPRACGSGYKSLCPAHNDHTPSLTISEGDDGRVLLHCHAGCDTGEICQSLGLTTADLFADEPSTPTKPTLGSRYEGFCRQKTAMESVPPQFDSDAEAIQALETRHGPATASWQYTDASGRPEMIVVRFETPSGKTYRPVSRRGDRWVIGGLEAPRPLYRLDELAVADTVFVCEGEKATDAARELGLTATTSSGGSGSALKTDWSPLSGKTVIILPDNDAAGEDFAQEVARILGGLER